MADSKISQLNSLTKSTIATTDVLPIVDVSANETKKITYQELIQPHDSQFRIAGSSDSTKLVAFEVDGLTTGTTRTITVPDADLTLVGTTTAQTLTNKILTSPQLNFGSDAAGDLIIRNGSGVTARLPAGTSGQILNIDSVTGLPAWVANPSGSDASTTVKGVVEEATQAEVEAGTAAGGTSARLFVNPSKLGAKLYYGYAADSGSNDTYAITLDPAPTAYTTGMVVQFKANTVNTGAATLNCNSLGAKTIKKNYNSDLSDGDIKANQIVTVIYDGTNFQMLSPVSNNIAFKNGVTTRNGDAADGTQTIAHGLGSTPRYVRISCRKAISSVNTAISDGVYNGTTTSCVWSTICTTGGGTDQAASGNDSTYIAYILDNNLNPANARQRATIAIDATNITLTWDQDATPTSATINIMWEAWA